MEKRHLNFSFPQWQGGGQDLSILQAGRQAKQHFFPGGDIITLDVREQDISPTKNDIIAYDDLLTQLRDALRAIKGHAPDSLFVLGGGCDADVAPMAYMNKKLDGNMALVWFDAHGDLNTPASSPSKYYYGMPLRTLLGEGDTAFAALVEKPLQPGQIVAVGHRDLDPEEERYVRENNVQSLSVRQVEDDVESLIQAVRRTGYKNVYIHLDMDVLDSTVFEQLPMPSTGGLLDDTLQRALLRLGEEFNVVGMGLYEFTPYEDEPAAPLRNAVEFGRNI